MVAHTFGACRLRAPQGHRDGHGYGPDDMLESTASYTPPRYMDGDNKIYSPYVFSGKQP
ncbi:protein of unknown function [Burkholderia multivorans]